MEHPRVFISYSHDSPDHSEWVRKLASDLRQSGVDAFLDLWDLRPGDDFVEKIKSAMAEADHCIIVCTPRYRQVAEKRRSSGVGYEQSLIHGALEDAAGKRGTVLPVVRAGDGSDALPDWLAGRVYLDLRDDRLYKKNFKRLLQSLMSSRGLPKPKSIPLQKDAPKMQRWALTIDAPIEDFDDAKLEKLQDLLRSYLGEGITIKEIKGG